MNKEIEVVKALGLHPTFEYDGVLHYILGYHSQFLGLTITFECKTVNVPTDGMMQYLFKLSQWRNQTVPIHVRKCKQCFPEESK